MTTAIAPEKTTAPVAETPATRTLTGHDRCDNCGSEAFAKVTLMTGDLMFCGHHFTAYEPKLRKLAITVVDEREWLTGQRRTAGDGFA